MEPEGSLPPSQVPTSFPYPEPPRSSPYPIPESVTLFAFARQHWLRECAPVLGL